MTIACIASCVYLRGVALRVARSLFNMFGRRTMTTLHESSGTFFNVHRSENTIYETNSDIGIPRYSANALIWVRF